MWSGLKTFVIALAPLFGCLLIIAALVNYLQIGSIFSTEPLKPNPNKMNPAENFKQKFLKPRPYIELAKTIIKMLIACAVVGLTLWDARADVVKLTTQPPLVAVYYVGSLLFQIGLRIGLAYIIMGGLDYFLQKFLHRKDLMMSKHEVREEYKETEGNPLIKHKRRQIHREIIAQAMMAAVKRANVVVTNPTHLAIALRYDKSEMSAPIIVAKGADLMAAQIREIAEEANVPIMRDVPLARALYELEIDDEIPEELYESVAVVLRWVYQLAEERGEIGVVSHA
jgi:flagellar biosynthetic protein FlhB